MVEIIKPNSQKVSTAKKKLKTLYRDTVRNKKFVNTQNSPVPTRIQDKWWPLSSYYVRIIPTLPRHVPLYRRICSLRPPSLDSVCYGHTLYPTIRSVDRTKLGKKKLFRFPIAIYRLEFETDFFGWCNYVAYIEITTTGERHCATFRAWIVHCTVEINILRPVLIAVVGDATTIKLHLYDIDQVLQIGVLAIFGDQIFWQTVFEKVQ